MGIKWVMLKSRNGWQWRGVNIETHNCKGKMFSFCNSWCISNMCCIYFSIWVSINYCIVFIFIHVCRLFLLLVTSYYFSLSSALSGLAILLCYIAGCIGTHFLIRYIRQKKLFYFFLSFLSLLLLLFLLCYIYNLYLFRKGEPFPNVVLAFKRSRKVINFPFFPF